MHDRKNKYAVAVAGAASIAGRELIDILAERSFPVGDLRLLDSGDAAGERIEFNGGNVVVRELTTESIAGADFSFFFTSAEQTRKFAPLAARSGKVVIDGSNAFPGDPTVPQIVPEVNGSTLAGHQGIVANPDCSNIGMAVVLKPIHDAVKIKRIVVTTFQSVSGTGKEAMDELAGQTVALLNFRDVETRVYPHQIAFNCIPLTGPVLENGGSQEEKNIADQMRKLLGDDQICISSTAVRVPVFRGYAASINIETEKSLSANETRALLAAAPGVVVYDDPKRNIYPLQIEAVGKDDIYAGRIREDATITNGLNLWIAFDDVRKGAALNAAQIAETLMK